MTSTPTVLASDLDGTLLPLDGEPRNRQDLRTLVEELQAANMRLAFVTGRHFESVMHAMQEFDLPTPDWIVCDVGTSIYGRDPQQGFRLSQPFADHLQTVTRGISTQELAQAFSHWSELRLQESEKQTRFKLSFYTDQQVLERVAEAVRGFLQERALPYSVIASIDPFTDDGLIDLLPQNSSKAYALNWWSQAEGFEHQQVLYAGDSGNDLAAFAAGYRSIVVGNAAADVLQRARLAHQQAGWSDRIFAATLPATSGVLEGVRYFRNGAC